MVAVANVFPIGLGVVALQRWLSELAWRNASDFLPEPLGSLNIRGLMDLDAERQLGKVNPYRAQEAHEKENQPRVTVNEDNTLEVVREFPFRAFAPVGNRPGDQHFTVREVACFGSCGSNLAGPHGVAGFALFCPVPVHTFG